MIRLAALRLFALAQELAGLLREAIERDRFPLSPRVRGLKAILSKLDASRPAPAPYPSPRAWVNSSVGRLKRRR